MKSVFKIHNPKINKFSQSSSENFSLMIVMVVLSIQQDWFSVGTQIKDYRKKGLQSRFVWGNKAKTVKYLRKHSDVLYEDALVCLKYKNKRKLKEELMKVFLQIDGLGLVKAGFCCQLFCGQVGCIDSHNEKRFGVSKNALSFDKKTKPETQLKKIKLYLDLCQREGCEKLWNGWCKHIADIYPKKWEDAHHVSRVHFDYVAN